MSVAQDLPNDRELTDYLVAWADVVLCSEEERGVGASEWPCEGIIDADGASPPPQAKLKEKPRVTAWWYLMMVMVDVMVDPHGLPHPP